MAISTPITNHVVAMIKLKQPGLPESEIEAKAEQLITVLGLNVVNKVVHSFPVRGTTLAYILSQSHLVIHTWPEQCLVHIDMATCDRRQPVALSDFENQLREIFEAEKIEEVQAKSII